MGAAFNAVAQRIKNNQFTGIGDVQDTMINAVNDITEEVSDLMNEFDIKTKQKRRGEE